MLTNSKNKFSLAPMIKSTDTARTLDREIAALELRKSAIAAELDQAEQAAHLDDAQAEAKAEAYKNARIAAILAKQPPPEPPSVADDDAIELLNEALREVNGQIQGLRAALRVARMQEITKLKAQIEARAPTALAEFRASFLSEVERLWSLQASVGLSDFTIAWPGVREGYVSPADVHGFRIVTGTSQAFPPPQIQPGSPASEAMLNRGIED